MVSRFEPEISFLEGGEVGEEMRSKTGISLRQIGGKCQAAVYFRRFPGALRATPGRTLEVIFTGKADLHRTGPCNSVDAPSRVAKPTPVFPYPFPLYSM